MQRSLLRAEPLGRWNRGRRGTGRRSTLTVRRRRASRSRRTGRDAAMTASGCYRHRRPTPLAAATARRPTGRVSAPPAPPGDRIYHGLQSSVPALPFMVGLEGDRSPWRRPGAVVRGLLRFRWRRDVTGECTPGRRTPPRSHGLGSFPSTAPHGVGSSGVGSARIECAAELVPQPVGPRIRLLRSSRRQGHDQRPTGRGDLPARADCARRIAGPGVRDRALDAEGQHRPVDGRLRVGGCGQPASERIRGMSPDGVTFDDVEVREVVAHA